MKETVIDTEAGRPAAEVELYEGAGRLICGTRDENLHRIETEFGVGLAMRGDRALINGPEDGVAAVGHLLAELSQLVERGHRLPPRHRYRYRPVLSG